MLERCAMAAKSCKIHTRLLSQKDLKVSSLSLKISFEKSGLSSVYMHMYMSYMRSEFDIARFRMNIF
ncbi:hypothetical protein TWF594_006095 [Orbilia oligospora]|nr:hypothetical protein TWF594_006095 [Orbilia oligospora]